MKKKKKGFTLVELLVVIAILAILATVSVVGYLSFTNKAKQSADEQAVTQMNIALEAQEAIDAPEDVNEARTVLRDAGFSVDDYVPLNMNNIFYYDETEVRVLIFDQTESKVTFPENLEKKYSDVSQKLGYWKPLNAENYEIILSGQSTDDTNADSTQLNLKIIGSEENNVVKLESDFAINNFFPQSTQIWDDKTTSYVTTYYFPTNSDGEANIDLGGHTLKFDTIASIQIGGYTGGFGNLTPRSADVTISNGYIEFTDDKSNFIINENSSLTLNNVEYLNSDDGSTPSPDGKGKYQKNSFTVNDYGRLTISDSTITNENGTTTSVLLYGNQSETNIFNSTLISRTFGITTNASLDQSWNIRAKIMNSKIICNDGTGILVNVPGTYTISNSIVEGDGQGVVIRGGNATFENSVVRESGENSGMVSKPEFSLTNASPFYGGMWGNGNMIQFAGLVVGDWSNSYNYDASCTLINSSIYMNDNWTELPIVYLSQDGDNTTTLTYDTSSKFYRNNELQDSESDNVIKINSAENAEYTDSKGNTIRINKGTINKIVSNN